MMLLNVPTGIGLFPCMATITWRPLGWRHFWGLPFWLTGLKPCLRSTRMTSLALQTGTLAHLSATSSTFAPAGNVTGAGSNQRSSASLAFRTASSSVSPAEAHPGNSGKNAAQRLVWGSCSTTSRSFIEEKTNATRLSRQTANERRATATV